MSNLTEASNVMELERMNSKLSHNLLPDTIIEGIYLFTGLIGNSVVLFIYVTRFRKNVGDRFFIPVLAAIDLTACCVDASFGMSINSLTIRFDNDVACKIMTYLAVSTTFASAYTLLIIAIQRYQKICRPFGRQMTLKWKKLSILIVWAVILIMAVPSVFFYGAAAVKLNDGHVIGRRCTSVTGGFPKIAIIYKGFLLLTIIVEVFALSVLYISIGKVILNPSRVTSRYFPDASKPDTTKTTLQTCKVRKSVPNANKEKCCPANEQLDHVRANSVKLRMRKVVGYRLSLIFMIITAVFIFSFVPKLVMMVYESLKEDFWLKLSPSELACFRFLYTLFIINNVANPFIYGFLDQKFRKELKSVCCRMQQK